MERNQQGTYIFYRDKQTGGLDNMNQWEWDNIQKNPNKKKVKENFEYIKTVNISEEYGKSEPVSGVEGKLPLVEDELECPLCGYIAKSDRGLLIHKKKKHV